MGMDHQITAVLPAIIGREMLHSESQLLEEGQHPLIENL